MRAACRGNYLNDRCSEYCRTYKEPVKAFRYGQPVQFTQDIIDGTVLIRALKGDGGTIEKEYGNTGCEWVVHTHRGELLKVNERQIKPF